MKKKIIALVLVVAMVAVSLISGTLAYLTDTAEATNVFAVGNIKITLEEEVAVTSKDGTIDYSSAKVVNNGTNTSFKDIMPGNKITKTVTVTNKDNAAYVRVVVVLNNASEINNAIDEFYEPIYGKDTDDVQAKYDEIFDGWNIVYTKPANAGQRLTIDTNYADSNILRVDTTRTIYDSTGSYTIVAADNWYENEGTAAVNHIFRGHYSKAMNPNEIMYVYYLEMDKNDTVTLFDGIYCPEEFGNEQIKMFENLQIEVYADAIQKEGFADAKTAFVALEEAHSLTVLRNLRPVDLPVADVADADQYENVLLDWNNVGGFYPPEGTKLESVYKFEVTETRDQAAASPYADWIADYWVSLNTDLGPNQIVLGGEYGDFGWVGFSNGDLTLDADTFIPLLGTVGLTFTYLDIIDYVSVFHCGVADIDNALTGATFTVELRLTNPNDANEYYIVNSTSYTFK